MKVLKLVIILLLSFIGTNAFCQNLDSLLHARYDGPANAKENTSITNQLEKKYGFVSFSPYRGGWYRVSRSVYDHISGAYSVSGKEVVPIKYNSITKEEYGYTVTIGTGKDWYDSYGLYDNDGNILLPCEYTDIEIVMNYHLEDGIFKKSNVYVIARGGSYKKGENDGYHAPIGAKYALYDIKNKRFITDFKYDYIDSSLGNKLIRFNIGGKVTNTDTDHLKLKDGLWGYLDESGKEIIPATYDLAEDFNDGMAKVKIKGKTKMIPSPFNEGAELVKASAVDVDIPQSSNISDNTFAFIFGVENYKNFKGADYSINDGKVISEYCKLTFGIPEKNLRYYEDATFGNFQKAISQIKDIADVYEGDAKFIFYYSGLGLIDEKTKTKFLLPSDASLTALSSTGINVEELLSTLSGFQSAYTLVFIDAPFDGNDRMGKALVSGRGVQLVSKSVPLSGNLIVADATSDNGTAYVDKDKSHGDFTYFFLEKIKSSKGKCTIKEALDYAKENVKKETLQKPSGLQSPDIQVSNSFVKSFNSIKF